MVSELRGALRWLLEIRYLILARLFGVPVSGNAETEPGVVFIQVDALGYNNLQSVLELGYMPHLKSLLESGEYAVTRWRCGLPSDTPPVQAGMMYGYNKDLAGFYWMDKASGRRQNCANPPHARMLEAHIASCGAPGLLSEGSSYGTIISGNARKTVFTVSRLESYHLSNANGLLGAILFFIFKPPLILTTAFKFLWDVVTELADYVLARATGRLRRREGIFPFTRAIINVLFREVSTSGAIMDMFCGLPVIYVSYLGYDVASHHNGPQVPHALRTLRGMDRAIGNLRRAARWTRRPYDIYILSDHGMNPSVPFSIEYGQPLSEYVASVVGERARVDEFDADRYMGVDQFSPLNNDLEEVERHLPKSLGNILRRTRTFVYRGDTYHTPVAQGRISVIDCSPIAHIYIHGLPRRLQLAEIEDEYPGLIEALISHPGIGLLMGLDGDNVMLRSKEGWVVLGDRTEVGGKDPLLEFEEPELAAREICRFALTPFSGDLILFGAVHGERTICFQNQLGAHGTMGGDQYYPFFMYPSDRDIDLGQVTVAAEMYPVLRRLARCERMSQSDACPQAISSTSSAG